MTVPITVEIVTPLKLVLRAQAESFVGQSVLGEFGLLAGHQPLLAALRAGVARCVTGNQEKRLAIGPGFAEFDNDRVIVLTENALDPATVETREERTALRAEAAAARDKADADMRAWNGPITAREFEEARLAFDWNDARVKVLAD
jgi:F-type H+-transporting ATPase subunit epsilon